MRLPPPIVALSPGTLASADSRAFVARVACCREAGLRGVMLREPRLSDREYLALAKVLRDELPREDRGWLALHDRPHLAAACEADAVHLGGRSLHPALLRGWIEPQVALGLSTHAADDAESWTGADYLVHGPVCATHKGDTRIEGIGFEALARGVARAGVPMWGLGGLGPEHATALVQAGASGLAVLSGLLARPDAERRAAEYVQAWLEATPKA